MGPMNRESLQCMRLFRVCCLARNAFVGAVPGRDAYSKYQPWEGGASYEGRMRLSYQDKNWRIVRNFYKDDSHFEVVDETSGRQEACASDDISSLIPGMQLSNYRNSISTGQLSVQRMGSLRPICSLIWRIWLWELRTVWMWDGPWLI